MIRIHYTPEKFTDLAKQGWLAIYRLGHGCPVATMNMQDRWLMEILGVSADELDKFGGC
tara:strand:- start:1318 stop:1494 length:177 start_codon:yes stop_codon:yes gene_type:complete